MNEAQLDAAFATPGLGATATQQGYGGGDYPHAYPLPDGRVFWMFQDLHFSNDENLRNDNAVDIANGSATNAAHNAGIIQQGDCFTIVGDRPRDLIGDDLTIDSRTWFWPMDGEVGIDGNLWISWSRCTSRVVAARGTGPCRCGPGGDPRPQHAAAAVLRARARLVGTAVRVGR